MPLLALSLITLCAREYQDIAFGRISKAVWLDWLNDAQRNVVLVRPDANAITATVALTAGPKQSLAFNTKPLRLLGVTRNMGSDGLTPGKSIFFSERESQDLVNRDWYSSSNASPVREVLYDDKRNPLIYWVRPGAVAGWNIEIIYASMPTDVTDADTGLITIPEVYAGPMQAWMLYRAFMLSTQAQGHIQRAQANLQLFFNLLGVKLRGELFQAPATPGAIPAKAVSG